MTKALLTQQDIKNFILGEISKMDRSPSGGFLIPQIAKKLNVPDYILRRRSREMKCAYVQANRRYYKLEDVEQYLKDHNIYYSYQQDAIIEGKQV